MEAAEILLCRPADALLWALRFSCMLGVMSCGAIEAAVEIEAAGARVRRMIPGPRASRQPGFLPHALRARAFAVSGRLPRRLDSMPPASRRLSSADVWRVRCHRPSTATRSRRWVQVPLRRYGRAGGDILAAQALAWARLN